MRIASSLILSMLLSLSFLARADINHPCKFGAGPDPTQPTCEILIGFQPQHQPWVMDRLYGPASPQRLHVQQPLQEDGLPAAPMAGDRLLFGRYLLEPLEAEDGAIEIELSMVEERGDWRLAVGLVGQGQTLGPLLPSPPSLHAALAIGSQSDRGFILQFWLEGDGQEDSDNTLSVGRNLHVLLHMPGHATIAIDHWLGQDYALALREIGGLGREGPVRPLSLRVEYPLR